MYSIFVYLIMSLTYFFKSYSLPKSYKNIVHLHHLWKKFHSIFFAQEKVFCFSRKHSHPHSLEVKNFPFLIWGKSFFAPCNKRDCNRTTLQICSVKFRVKVLLVVTACVAAYLQGDNALTGLPSSLFLRLC